VTVRETVAIGLTRTEALDSVAQVDFVRHDPVPKALIRANSIGDQMTYFRIDQAFEEPVEQEHGVQR
jgi:hypothetical protein